jgi:uncharacterized protein
MSLGLSQKFSILQQSPHDLGPAEPPRAPEEPGTIRWVPSRYTVRATTKDGRLVLWNTYNGAMSVFGGNLRAAVERLLTQKGFAARPLGAVKFLAERGFLVREGTNEYRRVQIGFGQEQYRTDRLELILLASEDCNFRCPYCYEDFARGTMQPWVRQGIKNLVQRRLDGLRTFSVSWFGGEPLYGFPAIEELGPFFVEIAEKHSIQFSSHMTTNGYLLTPEVADKLFAWRINKFQITIDGTPEDHDRNRPARDGQGTFWPIFDNLRALHARADDFQVDLRINFDRLNHDRLGGLMDMVKEEFGNDPRFKLRFRGIGQWGGPNDDQLQVCGAEESVRVAVDLREEARRRGLNVADDIREVKGMGAHVCYAARPYNLIVGASGKLMKCTIDLDKQDRNVVGYLKENGELDIDFDKFALWTEPAFEQDGKCQKCVILPVCQGTFCPLIRIETGDSPCTPLRKTYKKDLRAVVEIIGAEEQGKPAVGHPC